ncbi:hypothetical protein AB0M28_32185 [Streptomyces sp. NPDC051940]|uniref:hypothetical protein n=1 Tax=Streptomyces sp. NPDC051940 TaxID=3155675 RepID=UPI00344774A8
MTEEQGSARTGRLTVAAVLTAVEGAVVAGLGVYMLVMLFAGDPESRRSALFGGLTVLALAVLPLAAARGLWLLRSWSRGPAVITQLMAIPVVWTMVDVGGALLAPGIALGAVALAALVMLMSPSTVEALGIGPKQA